MARLPRFKLTIEYAGTRYSGWQIQQNAKTVAGEIERAIAEVSRRDAFELYGAGRTDAGVHALGQVAHLRFGAGHDPGAARLAEIFEELPSDVAVRTLSPCDPRFHARHHARSRSYLYQVALRRSGLAKPFVWRPRGALDVDRRLAAWSLFPGVRNVSAFCELDRDDDPRCEIQACESLRSGSLVLLRITASHFLRRQVRRSVGAAVAVATGEATPEELARDLAEPTAEAKLKWSTKTAPPSGLILESVRYDGDPEPGELRALTLVP